jgi:hypothetical protein
VEFFWFDKETTNSLNLFFCFRWILVAFKREFAFDSLLAIWENFWTDLYGRNFHLFFALAILEAHREYIMRYLEEFDEVLKVREKFDVGIEKFSVISLN